MEKMVAEKEKQLPGYVQEDKLEDRLTDNAVNTFRKKYLNRDTQGKIVETPKFRIYTTARTIAEAERAYGADEKAIDRITEEYYKLMSSLDFLPGGRILTNAGKGIALFNCYVLPIDDLINPGSESSEYASALDNNIETSNLKLFEMKGIFGHVQEAAMIHQQGGGTGFNFSNLRPRGSYVARSQGVASGPVSFIGQFDKQTDIINSGNRRGANMGILNVEHPDILDFIYAKTIDGELKNFNVSIGASDEFMKAVESDGYYNLKYKKGAGSAQTEHKLTKATLESFISGITGGLAGAGVGEATKPHSLALKENKVYDNRTGEEIGRVNEQEYIELKASKIFDLIANLAWKTGDPGMVFLDTLNKNQPLTGRKMEATNPCGEQPLYPYEACNLGSINLANFVEINEDKTRKINYERLGRVVESAVRFLDDTNDASKGPIKEIEETVKQNRRIGLGIMGLSDMLIKLRLRYDSEPAEHAAEEVMDFINKKAFQASHELAKERGIFPNFEKSRYNTGKEEDRVRNLTRTTIAPTGSISMVANVSSGIEPVFGIFYTKNMRGGDSMKFLNPDFEAVARERGFYTDDLVERIANNKGSLQGLDGIPDDIKEIFRVSKDISSEGHVRMQAAVQRHVDNAVSKTINMPNSATVEEVKQAYLKSWKLGCKGVTVYRQGSKDVEVLVSGNEIPDIQFGVTELNNNLIHPSYFSTHYKITRHGKERLHVILTSRLFMGNNNNYYMLPHAEFHATKPIGTELASEFSQQGVNLTQILQGHDPDYVTLVTDLKSVKGDRVFGFGMNRIDSPSHGVGLCLEHFLLTNRILQYDETKNLVQKVRKPELKEMPKEEAEELFFKWLYAKKEKNEKGEMHVLGNRNLGIRFTCKKCGGKDFTMKDGCTDPVCAVPGCGWSSGKCD